MSSGPATPCRRGLPAERKFLQNRQVEDAQLPGRDAIDTILAGLVVVDDQHRHWCTEMLRALGAGREARLISGHHFTSCYYADKAYVIELYQDLSEPDEAPCDGHVAAFWRQCAAERLALRDQETARLRARMLEVL